MQHGDFLFDTGAHRFHDKDASITAEIKQLLGEKLRQVTAPSQIYYRGKWIHFPLSPGNLLKQMDGNTLLKIAWENLRRRSHKQAHHDFKAFAENAYGKTLANLFLLNYSEKLWGKNAAELSPQISGGRLKNLNIAAFLKEITPGRWKNRSHLDGSFYYPEKGIGMIFQAIENEIGREKIHLNHRITAIHHDKNRIQTISVNNQSQVPTDVVINTLPLTQIFEMLRPLPPEELLAISRSIRFRDVRLAVFFLTKARFSENASLYFPDPALPFTRIYEPKNRSAFMAPAEKTCIVLEIPCFKNDPFFAMQDTDLRTVLTAILVKEKLLKASEINDFRSLRIPFAYPVLTVGFEEKVAKLHDYLKQFENHYLSGRNALFAYAHIHQLFAAGKEMVDIIANMATTKVKTSPF